jgi:hypothetical protein
MKNSSKNSCDPLMELVEEMEVEVELFTWEKLDYVNAVKKAFKLS